MGQAERINATVLPVTYRLFLHFTIYLFVIVLSIAIKNVDTIFEIPLLAVISMVSFLLKKNLLPFGETFQGQTSDTLVTAIARTIKINIRQLLGEMRCLNL